ncbi:MAG: GNAT family N-acetyltransferase [Candidatus Babeliaceae bacterium]|nr:GNAT family N-acetyltransferase [Candidatus Babeliaceae bacterium]
MSEYLQIKPFSEIDLNDSFFDGLKIGYTEFSDWYAKKAKQGATAYVLYTGGNLIGFMYLKIEEGTVDDTTPHLPPAKRVKIGTLKVEAHGTRLGERFLKKAIDFALSENADELYLTVFPKHDDLISLIIELGFKDIAEKTTMNGTERVLAKNFTYFPGGTLRQNYPFLQTHGSNKYLLSIYPQWHTKLFPDSILDSESYDLLTDVSHTNSIRKTYVCKMKDVGILKAGDLAIIYRTKDEKGPGHYRSVVTSVCIVEELRSKENFTNLDDFVNYTMPYSVFNREELSGWWKEWSRVFVIKMLYSTAFSKRIIRKTLIEDIGLDSNAYWGFMPVTDEQFLRIMRAGGINERLIINKA